MYLSLRKAIAIQILFYQSDFCFNAKTKNNKLNTRNAILTDRANGGATSGHNWPNNTITLRTTSTIIAILFIVFVIIMDC